LHLFLSFEFVSDFELRISCFLFGSFEFVFELQVLDLASISFFWICFGFRNSCFEFSSSQELLDLRQEFGRVEGLRHVRVTAGFESFDVVAAQRVGSDRDDGNVA
jgi:hypothetical protein